MIYRIDCFGQKSRYAFTEESIEQIKEEFDGTIVAVYDMQFDGSIDEFETYQKANIQTDNEYEDFHNSEFVGKKSDRFTRFY